MKAIRLLCLMFLLAACSGDPGSSNTPPTLPSVPATPPVINSFTASRDLIYAGDDINLFWDVTGAESLDISPGVGAVTGASSSVEINVGETTTYTLTATNGDGSDTAEVTVSIRAERTGFIRPNPVTPTQP